MSGIFDHLQRERDAFELFKQAYKASFPAGAGGPPPVVPWDVAAPEPLAGADAESASAALLFVALDVALFASADECLFAEIEWL